MKKTILICLSLMLALACFVGCAQKPTDVSSTQPQTEQSSQITSAETSSEENSSTVTTTSSNQKPSSTPSTKVEPEETSSETESSSVKVYKNKGTVQLGAYHLNLKYCTANGDSNAAMVEEFQSVLDEGYFNTFFISSNTSVLDNAKMIAEAGATFWLHVGDFRKSKMSIESYIEDAVYYVNLLKKMGYGDLINGFYWDEPVWRGMTNEEFLTMTKALYQEFGLRNFPVFATGEFSGLEGNEIGVEADDMNKVLSSSLKYVTDAAFDAYGVDVRDGVVPTDATLARWREKISPDVNNSKDYYTGFKKKLLNHIGHPVNVWYYPCCYEAPVGTGLNNIKRADEGYCLGHLEFMAQDILKEEYPGGLVLYTYHTSGTRYGLQRHLAIKDKNGNYKYYPNEVKWDRYCEALKTICAKFSATKAKRADIGV